MKLWVPTLFVLFCFSYQGTIAQQNQLSPCLDYFDYVCKSPKPTALPKLPSYHRELFGIVWNTQNYTFPDGPKNRSLLEIVSPVIISKWLAEYHKYLFDVKWEANYRKHEDFLKLNESQQNQKAFDLILDFYKPSSGHRVEVFNHYYTGLKNAVKYFRKLNDPIVKKNSYYHGVWKDILNLLNRNIMEHSKLPVQQREAIQKKLNSTKVYFPFLDFNNVTIWEQAIDKFDYTYLQLKSQLSEQELKNRHSEVILRFGAIAPSLEILVNYMAEFSDTFIFQSVVSMLVEHSFNYRQEVHISVLPRIDPTDSKSVMTDIVFVITRELLHSIYNLDPHPFESKIWKTEQDCVLRKLKVFGTNDTFNVEENVKHKRFIYEDIVNMEAIRVVMQLSAKQSRNDQELRDLLEHLINSFCDPVRTIQTYMKTHKFVEITFNNAASQLPNFNSLYNCSAEDRMYTKPAEICQTMAVPQTINLYKPAKN